MFFDIVDGNSIWIILSRILASMFVVFIVFPLHNYVQMKLAYKLGDRSLKDEECTKSKRMLRHIDLFGSLFILLFNFGWPELFSINYACFKDKKYKYMTYITLAGMGVYFFFALVFGVATALLVKFTEFGFEYLPDNELSEMFTLDCNNVLLLLLGSFFMSVMFSLLMTMIVNIIPFPPLSGFRLISPLVKKRVSKALKSFEPIFILALTFCAITRLIEMVLKPFLYYICLNPINLCR